MIPLMHYNNIINILDSIQRNNNDKKSTFNLSTQKHKLLT